LACNLSATVEIHRLLMPAKIRARQPRFRILVEELMDRELMILSYGL
jgi:hypothetical protein